MWGAYLGGLWLYRLSLAKVKWHSLTGRPLTGVPAAEVELINEAVPFEHPESRVAEIAAELARIPLSQLRAQKLIVNQAYENMDLASTQMLGGILDGPMRNTPEALNFIRTAASDGVRTAIEHRDGPVRRLQPGAAGAATRSHARHHAATKPARATAPHRFSAQLREADPLALAFRRVGSGQALKLVEPEPRCPACRGSTACCSSPNPLLRQQRYDGDLLYWPIPIGAQYRADRRPGPGAGRSHR